MRAWAGCILALALLAVSSTAAAQFRITGGSVASASDYPFVVAFSRFNGMEDRRYFCGGVLVAPSWVLTAAHCFHNAAGERLPDTGLWAAIGAGDLLEVDAAQQRAVGRVVLHPDYDASSQRNDVALVRLARPVTALSATLETSREFRSFAPYEVIGFGKLASSESSQTLRTRAGEAVVLQSHGLMVARSLGETVVELCRELLSEHGLADSGYHLGQGQLCAGGRFQDACQGDSGGPLLLSAGTPSERKVVGLISFGFGCGQQGVPGVYTRVADYLPWIASVTRDR